MADSWLPDPEDYAPPFNGDLIPDTFKRGPAKAEAAAEADTTAPEQPAAADQPDPLQEAERQDETPGPYPPPAPTVTGDQVTQSVYLGGITQ